MRTERTRGERIAFYVVAAVLLLGTLALHAQAPNIASYDLLIFAPGVDPNTGAPIQDTPFAASTSQCNQTPIVTLPTSVTNPNAIEFDDAAHPGQVCVLVFPANLLVALPFASGYSAALTQTDTSGSTSARGVAVNNPFSFAAAPATITGAKLLRK